jgi:hypothetical protein
MKRLIFCALFIAFVGLAAFKGLRPNPPDQIEVRSGDWPIFLERTVENSVASYSLQFRDEQVLTGVVMDTLEFPDLGQLKYFGKALSVLKTGNNGDIAKFSNFSIKRADKKYDGIWYILRIKWGLTDFRQPESDIMINAIKGF